MPRTLPAKLVIIIPRRRRRKSRTSRRTAAARFLGLLIVLLVVTGSQPLPTTINIAKGQYNAALAKWNSLHITDYEVTAHLRIINYEFPARPALQSKWKFVAHIDRNFIDRSTGMPEEWVTHVEGDGGISPDDTIPPYQTWTVGSLFYDLGLLLQYPSPSGTFDERWWPTYTFIQFDPTMGYPRLSRAIFRNYVTEVSIDNVRVLK